MQRTIRRLWPIVATTAAFLLVAAGCGSSSKTSTSSTTAKGATATTKVGAETTKAAAKPAKKLKVAVITPSAENDLAFSQSMMEALATVGKERGAEGMELAKSNNLFKVEDAGAAIRDYATKGFDVVVAHGSQYGALVKEIAPQFPKVAFAWGTAADTFNLPNVFAYEVAADEGGYVLGSIAGLLTKKDNIGVVGPVEVGDAKAYIEGFKKGVAATKASAKVNVTYIGSFSDVAKAAETAKTFTTGGADVLTGTAQMVAGAVPVADSAGVPWFGTQSNQTPLSKKVVVASQVYDWSDSLRDIFSMVEKGSLGGKTYKLTLANKGLVIQYNPDYKLDAAAKAKGDDAAKAIAAGTLKTGVS